VIEAHGPRWMEAKPGQILISPRVLTKVENAVKVEPVGEFELKGIRRPPGGVQRARRKHRRLRDQRAGSFFYVGHTRPHLTTA
jgi:class 3 adenylate cyclase